MSPVKAGLKAGAIAERNVVIDPAHISRADEAAAACALVVGVIGVAAAVLGKTNVLGGFTTAFAAARAVGGDGGKELMGGSEIHD